MPDPLTIAKSIAWALRAARDRGETPIAIVLDPEARRLLREASLGSLWGPRPSLFNLPVEVDASAEGWAIRVR